MPATNARSIRTSPRRSSPRRPASRWAPRSRSIAQHDAIALAKAIATLDHLSGGSGHGRRGLRLQPRGSRRPRDPGDTARGRRRGDRAAHPPRSGPTTKPSSRASTARYLGSRCVAEAGAARRVRRYSSARRPTPRTFDRIVDWADGWIPMGVGILDDGFESNLAELRKRWGDAGRVEELQVCCFFQPGTVDAMTQEIERATELGVQRMQVYLEDRDREAALPILDDLAVVVERVARRDATERRSNRRAHMPAVALDEATCGRGASRSSRMRPRGASSGRSSGSRAGLEHHVWATWTASPSATEGGVEGRARRARADQEPRRAASGPVATGAAGHRRACPGGDRRARGHAARRSRRST